LLHDLVPKAVRIAVLVNPANVPAAEAMSREIPEAARTIGLQIQVLNASTSREIEAAFATLVRDQADALFVAADIFFAADVSNLRHSRRAMGFPQPMPLARLSKLVG
jgi:putative tryptophan/tyrosine transport system substrate-binding protein